MNKKIVSFAMTSVMAFALAVSAAAEEPSIQVGGVLEIGGEVKNTTSDYTVVIPTGPFTDLDLSTNFKNSLGEVKVVRKDDTRPFDPTKKVVITTASAHGGREERTGALYNQAADAYLKYELSNGSTNGDGDLIYSRVFSFHMFFSADNINNGNSQPLYLAVVDSTDTAPNGTYTDTLTFQVELRDA